MTRHRDERVFLVRMWRERETTENGSWLGSIHDVASGRRFYVTAPSEITDFITVSLDHGSESDVSRAQPSASLPPDQCDAEPSA